MLEQSYSRHFGQAGRPAHDARLVIGLLLLKHMTKLRDAEIVQLVRENPYMQAFCGLDNFASGSVITCKPFAASITSPPAASSTPAP